MTPRVWSPARLAFALVPSLCALAFALARLLGDGADLAHSYGHGIAAGMAGASVGVLIASLGCARATSWRRSSSDGP